MMLDDFVRDLETAQNIPAAGELQVLAREMRDRVLGAKDDPAAWLPSMAYVAGAGWQRMELLLIRLVEENAAVLSTEALGSLRIAASRISNQLFAYQRFIDTLLPGLESFDQPPQLLGNPTLPAELGEIYRALVAALPADQSLDQMPERCAAARAVLAQLQAGLDRLSAARNQVSLRNLVSIDASQIDEARTWCRTFDEKLALARAAAQDLLSGLQEIDQLAETYFHETLVSGKRRTRARRKWQTAIDSPQCG
jgi:cob(I)alamin adenosyltransferase